MRPVAGGPRFLILVGFICGFDCHDVMEKWIFSGADPK